jgi:hypothetical protein
MGQDSDTNDKMQFHRCRPKAKVGELRTVYNERDEPVIEEVALLGGKA